MSHGKILEDGNIPVFLVTFSTQEVLMFRNSLSGEIAVGAPDKVEQCMYAAVITRVEDELNDELTAGWKIIEVGVCSLAKFFLLLFSFHDCGVSPLLFWGRRRTVSPFNHSHLCSHLCVWWLHISSQKLLADKRVFAVRFVSDPIVCPPRFNFLPL